MAGWSFAGQHGRNGKSDAPLALLRGNPYPPEIARNLGADGYR